MFGGDQAGKDPQASRFDREIMEAAAKPDAAHFDHAKPPPLRAVIDGELLEHHDAVRNRVQLQVVLGRREVVEQHDRAFAVGEEMLQGQDLAPVAQRVLGKQAQLGQAVEHHAGGIDALDLLEDEIGRFAQLHLGGMEHRELAVRIERRLRWHQFEDLDALERPAMPFRDEV